MTWTRAWAWFGMAATLVQPAPPAVLEYALKAQILVELLPYVQLPTETERSDRPFRIGVIGKSPFGSHLDAYARARTIHRRPIRLSYLNRILDAEGCDVVFICRSEIDRADAILAWATARKVLTLSDDETLAQRGTMVNLLMETRVEKPGEARFVRITVNPEQAASAGVFLGSQILRNARILPSTARPTPRTPTTGVPSSAPGTLEAP